MGKEPSNTAKLFDNIPDDVLLICNSQSAKQIPERFKERVRIDEESPQGMVFLVTPEAFIGHSDHNV